MKKLVLSLVVIGAIASNSAFAVSEVYGLSRSIRALGMGGAFYGLSDDEYALFYNPAGLALYRGEGQTMLSFNGYVSPTLLSAAQTLKDVTGSNATAGTIADKLTKYQGDPLSAGVTPFFPYYLRKNFAVGLLVGDTKINFALLGRDIDTSVDIAAISDSGLFIGYAHSFLEDTLHIGMTLKAVGRAGGKKNFTLADIAQKDDIDFDPEKLGGFGGGIDADLGGIYELPDVPVLTLHRVSMTFNNLLGSDMSISRKGANPPGLTRTVSLGYHAVFPGFGPFDNIHGLVDLAEFRIGGEDDPQYGAPGGSKWKHVNWGVEAPMNGWFVPRLGFHQGYLTAGFGLNLRVLKLEFATYAAELSSTPGRLGSRRVALRLQLGLGSAPPDPILHSVRKKPIEGAPAEMKKEIKQPEPPVGVPDETKVPRTPQSEGELLAPGPILNAPADETPAFPTEGAEVPRVEGNSTDRFGVDNAVEEQPSAP